MSRPFEGSQHLYDAIYSWKDYPAEVERLRPYLRGSSVLDVACGTGGHISHLRSAFEVVGVDIDPAMIAIARAKNPGAELHVADMREFNLGRTFGTVACLFSSVGYLDSPAELDAAVACMARHAEPGGMVLVEPWLETGAFDARPPQVLVDESPERAVVRMALTEVKGNYTELQFQYLVGTATGIEHLEEVHRLRLFTAGDYLRAFEHAGLRAGYDEKGPMGRGLYFGEKA